MTFNPLTIVGIDPGVSGAIAVYRHGGDLADPATVELFDMPVIAAKRGKAAMDVDILEVCAILRNANPDRVVVEQVTSRPRQAGQFAFGTNYGRLLGCIQTMGFELHHASPQAWKQAMGLRGEDKGMSVTLAAQLFPGAMARLFGARGAAKDGRAEALLLAYYGVNLKEQ